MPGLRGIAIRGYRKLFGAPAGSDIREEGLDSVLGGNDAVALTEAAMASHIVRSAEGPRGIVAAATGLALAGRRATAFVSGPDLAAAQDLLVSAAGKHAPLVLHMTTHTIPAHGSSPGSSHDAVHLSADSGFFVLFAANVQEAVDFTYIARRVAEASLVPGMVVMDSEQTALAAQDVRLPSAAQISGFPGSARESVDSPTAAQKMLFGDSRRRVPAWYDLDEPVLTGALFEKESFALGAFAREPFFDSFVEESLAGCFELYARRTGRSYDHVSGYKLDDAQTVLVAQGAAVETAQVAADRLRRQLKIRVGVLGIRTLRPFPGAAISAALSGRERVFVLERVLAPLSGEPPLVREVRASLDRGSDNGYPTCRPVVYGVGGLPLRVGDLVELCSNADNLAAEPLFLGLSFDDISGEQPKREVLLDALRRAYPNAARLGIVGRHDSAEFAQDETLTISIRRTSGPGGEGILAAAGALLYSLEGGRIRSRPAVSWARWSDTRVDWLIHGNDSLQDPGDALSADITLDVSAGTVTLDRESRAFSVPPQEDAGTGDEPDPEILLGALFGVLAAAGRVGQKARRIIAARREMLADVDEARRDEMLATFQTGLQQVVEVDAQTPEATDDRHRWKGEVPSTVRHLGRGDDRLASLPRFWDQLGVLYRDGKSDRLTADPFLATGTMPLLSSTFTDTSATRTTLPVFDPTLCTGCGHCWTHCPDSAIGAVAVSPAALIDAGIRHTGAEAVRQVSSKLGSRIIAVNKKAENVLPTFGQMLDDSFTWLKDKMPLPDERKRAIQDGIDSIAKEFGALPVAVTKPFFAAAEARKKDSAELLSLAINPNACKSCGLCVSSCEPGALRSAALDDGTLKTARELWSTWARTPDTLAETLDTVAEDADVGVMAAILLSRYCQFALAGGDPAEAGSGEKMAVRLALSAAEFHQQPVVQRFAKTLFEAGEAVSSLIRETLSGTLAVDDLDAVTEKLLTTSSPRVDVIALAEGVGKDSADHSVDTRYLLRLIDLSNRITAAHERLVQGEHGLGRARYGVAVAGGTAASWAGSFPYNPFQAPVLVDMSGDAAQLAAGLIEGHLDETAELVRLLRLARLETDQPDGADWKREELASLNWKELSDEELELCPPLMLIGSDEMLAGRGLGQLVWLLNSGLPVKVLALSSLDFGLTREPINDPRGSLGLLALAQRDAFVAQTSVAEPTHLGESMLQALSYAGPALIQVYAPSPTRHGFASKASLLQARSAIDCRVLPLFRYSPTADGVFGSRISLDGNPAPAEMLVPAADDGYLLTPADWALGQRRFASNFEPLGNDAVAPTPLHEWLQLDSKSRAGKTPYVAIGGGDDEERFSMSPAMVDMAAQNLQVWRTLQELAGIVTPFTERLEQDIRAEVQAEHQAELDAQKEASDAQIAEIQRKTQAEIASKIRSRLLQLASQKRE